MKRIIYSIYIDIPSDELDYQPPYHGETEDKNQKAKRVFRENYEWLTHMQKSWSNSIGIEYRQYTRDDKYLEFESFYKEKYPFVTTWNIVNFYKLHLMYELSKEGFDEILYLDIDVVPVSKLNFFEEWNLDHGIAILTNDPKIDRSLKTIEDNARWRNKNNKSGHSIRSPAAKYWNCYALLEEEGYEPHNSVYNTGIVGISSKYLKQLDYFGDDFDYILNKMLDLKNDEFSMYPLWIQEIFGWDNETIWGFKTVQNEVPVQLLNEQWHHFMDKWNYIPDNTSLVHVINKNFNYVREWCEKNNIQHI